MTHPSPAYFQALANSKKFHLKQKGFSGRFMFRYAEDVRELIRATGATSMLDYGCGRGVQYERPMEDGRTLLEYLGLQADQVRKYDPAWPPFEAEPKGQWDVVVCTQVLGSVPVQDLPWVLDRLFMFARRAVYIAEVLTPSPRKRLHHDMADDGLMPHGWTHEEWRAQLGAVWRQNPGKTLWFRTKNKLVTKGPRLLERTWAP